MKIKIIRKFLASAIAISTFASTPGLAGAVPKKSGVGENSVNKNLDQTNDENESTKEKCIAVIENVLNEYDDYDIPPESIYMSKGKDFVDSLKFLSDYHQDIFQNTWENFSEEKMTKILCFLNGLAEYDPWFGHYIMQIIQNLSSVCFSKEGIIKILDIFHACRNHFDSYGMLYIFENSKSCYLGSEKEVFSKAADVFLYLAEQPSNVSDVVRLMNGLINRDMPLLNYCTSSQISKIIDYFDTFIKEHDGLYTNRCAIAIELARHPKLKECSKESILKFKNIVINLINDPKFLNSKYTVPAVCIAELVKTGILTNLEKQQTTKIADELLKYSEDNVAIPISIFETKYNNDERFNTNAQSFEKPGAYDIHAVYSKSILPRTEADTVSEATSCFGFHIYKNDFKTDSDHARRTATIIKNLICCPTFDRSELAVIDILSECAKTKEAKDAVLAAVAHMSHNPSFSIDLKTQMTKIIEILNICLKDCDRQFAISSIIGQLAQSDFFKESSNDDMLKIIDILSVCAKNDETRKNVKFSLEKMLLDSNASPDAICQMLDLLFKCAATDSDKGNIVAIIEYLTFSEKFKNCTPNAMPILRLVDILNKCCGDNKTQASAKIIEKLTNSHLIEYSNKCMNSINDILEKCSSNKFARKNVANSVEQLLNNKHVNDLSNKNNDPKPFFPGYYSQIYRILKILNNCLVDCYGDVALKVISSMNLITLPHSRIQNVNDGWIVKNLIILLNNCACNNIVKKDCVKFINKLIVDKCFSDDYLSSTLNLLQKCAEYAPAKTEVLAAVQSLVDGGYVNPNNVSSYKDQIFSLILNCSEHGDNKEIFDMIHKKLFPNE